MRYAIGNIKGEFRTHLTSWCTLVMSMIIKHLSKSLVITQVAIIGRFLSLVQPILTGILILTGMLI